MAMRRKELIQSMMTELRDQVQDEIPLESLSTFLGVSPSQVSRFLNGITAPDIDKVFGCLEAAELPPLLFFEVSFVKAHYGPGQVLRYFRENGQATVTAFVVRAAKLAAFLRPAAEKAAPSSRREALMVFEDRRFDDPLGAKEGLEAKIDALIDEASMGDDAPRELLGDIAAALSIWASVQRLRNFRDDAGTALEVAFRLAFACGEFWVLGLVYQKSAYLLMDLSATDRGILFLKEAADCFELARMPDWKARAFVDRGVLLNSAKRHEEAIPWLELAIEQLPECATRSRFSAYHNVSIAKSALGRLTEAAADMAQASTLCPGYPLAEATLIWLAGGLHHASGELTASIEAHRKAGRIFKDLGNWKECALVLTDLAKSLLQVGDKNGLAGLTAEAIELAGKLQRNKAAASALREFALLCVRGSVAPPNLKDLEEDLEAAFPERLPHLDQN